MRGWQTGKIGEKKVVAGVVGTVVADGPKEERKGCEMSEMKRREQNVQHA